MPSHARPQVTSAVGEEKRDISHAPHSVRDEQFFGHAERETFDAVSEAVARDVPVPQLIFDVRVFDNRPSDELRKKSDIEAEIDDVALHARIAAVNIDQIRNRMKCKKRNADRQMDVVDRDGRQSSGNKQRIGESSLRNWRTCRKSRLRD